VDLTVSRPVNILARILVIEGGGGIAAKSLLGKSSPAGGAPLSVAQIRARAHSSTSTRPRASTPAAKTHAKAKAVASPPVHTAPAPKAKPKPAPVTAANGLPVILNDALRAHRIVVVSVFDPQSQTDAISYAEARAGAGDVSLAGFLGVSVLDDSVAGPLTAALPGGGLLAVPGLLIYRRPGTLVERVDGFADREAVAQLALAAMTAPAVTAPVVTTPVAPAPAPVVTPPADTTTTP
jgi:hypothetical protein